MSQPITLQIDLFGSFRQYGAGTPLTIHAEHELTLAQLKEHIKKALLLRDPTFDRPELVDESAIADDQQIYSDDLIIAESRTLAILPPVCGG